MGMRDRDGRKALSFKENYVPVYDFSGRLAGGWGRITPYGRDQEQRPRKYADVLYWPGNMRVSFIGPLPLLAHYGAAKHSLKSH